MYMLQLVSFRGLVIALFVSLTYSFIGTSITRNLKSLSIVSKTLPNVASKANKIRQDIAISNSFAAKSKDTQLNAQQADFNDVINPSKFDVKRIIFTLAGQAVLTAAAFALGSIYNIDVLHLENLQTETTILQETVLPSLSIFLAIITFSYLVKDVQLSGLQEFFRERKFYVLKTLGLRTDKVLAILIAVIIALGEGFSDEIFFRGFVFSSIHTSFGDETAIAFGALISGLAHIPLFGSNFFVESALSFLYGNAYLASNFNIIVPMTIHAIYSLVSMYVTWFYSTAEIKKRINEARSKTAMSGTDGSDGDANLGAMAEAIFDIIDLDRSGQIDMKEMKLGLGLFGFSEDVLNPQKVKGTNYDVISKLSDSNEISKEKFISVLKEGLKSWPRFDENEDYWKK